MVWLSLVVLLCCSGAISAMETALFGVNRRTLREFSRSGRRLRRRVHIIMQHPHRVLMTVLITNTAINVAIFGAAFAASRSLSPSRPVLAAVIGVAVLASVITFGEIMPKTIALANAKRLAPIAAGLIDVLQVVLAPIRWFLRTLLVDPLVRLLSPSAPGQNAISTDELKLLVEHSAEAGLIDSNEHEMLQAIVGAGEVSVRQIMTPRVDLLFAGVSTPRQTILRTMRTHRLRRMLVCGRDLDDITGVLYTRQLLLAPEQPVRSLVRPVRFVPEQSNLVQLLRHFRSTDISFAVVVDEYGGTAGFVSIEDVMEWMIGDVSRSAETRRPAVTEQIDENTYRVSGNLSARLLAERFSMDRIDRNIDTVGGLVLAKLGRLPRVGDSVRIRNLTLTVDQMQKRRIEQILLRRDNHVPTDTEQGP